MSWTFGSITLPKPPSKVIRKAASSIQKIPIMIEQPWLLSMGPDVPMLALEGEAFEASSIVETLYTTYFDQLYDYVGQKQTIDEPLLGDAVGATVWTGGTAVQSTAEKVKYEESTRVTAWGPLKRTFATARDFSQHNIVSIWIKSDVADSVTIKFGNTALTATFNWTFSTTTSWARYTIATQTEDGSPYLSSTTGSPDWSAIEAISITGSQNAYLDAFYIAHGWQLSAPGTRYDGIYVIADLEMNEGEGEIHSFSWRLNLYNKTQFFGEV
jgi:hypothetical protein